MKTHPSEKMHLAVVACGERLEETVTMLRSAIIFSIKPLHFHIFAEDQLHESFKDIVSIKNVFNQMVAQFVAQYTAILHV